MSNNTINPIEKKNILLFVLKILEFKNLLKIINQKINLQFYLMI